MLNDWRPMSIHFQLITKRRETPNDQNASEMSNEQCQITIYRLQTQGASIPIYTDDDKWATVNLGDQLKV